MEWPLKSKQKHILDCSKDLTDDPTLPRYSKRPRRYDDGEAGLETYFKQLYFEAIDLCHGEPSNRFSQTKWHASCSRNREAST